MSERSTCDRRRRAVGSPASVELLPRAELALVDRHQRRLRGLRDGRQRREARSSGRRRAPCPPVARRGVRDIEPQAIDEDDDLARRRGPGPGQPRTCPAFAAGPTASWSASSERVEPRPVDRRDGCVDCGAVGVALDFVERRGGRPGRPASRLSAYHRAIASTRPAAQPTRRGYRELGEVLERQYKRSPAEIRPDVAAAGLMLVARAPRSAGAQLRRSHA